jgi:hypothetical protein
MSSKPIPTSAKPDAAKSARKSRKGATETSRLFIHVEEIIRHPQTTPLTRYVE